MKSLDISVPRMFLKKMGARYVGGYFLFNVSLVPSSHEWIQDGFNISEEIDHETPKTIWE